MAYMPEDSSHWALHQFMQGMLGDLIALEGTVTHWDARLPTQLTAELKVEKVCYKTN